MKINNIQYDKQIPFDSIATKYFTEIPSVYPIPANTIIYKTITGIGATYGEIKAGRNSIIVLPHISIVKSKHEQHKDEDDTFAVYHEVSALDVFKYLTEKVGLKKFLTTPKGLNKIIRALEETDAADIYKEEFFLLVDESHKLIQDAMYRDDMVEMMEHFFTFKSKAMISATPIPPSDPRFEKQGFEHIRVYPVNDYKKQLLLVQAESIIGFIKEHIESSNAKHICVFFNSVDGIVEIVNKLRITSDYMIFCSEESTKMLKSLSEPNVSHEMRELSKYNFFTSSFFNGLDIELDHKDVDIILVSDVDYRAHTLLDPFTDVLQIIGRFRKGYRQAIHVNNCKAFSSPLTEEQTRDNIAKSKVVYEAITTLQQTFVDRDFDLLFKQAVDAVKPYSNLVDKEGNYNFFLADNYLDDCRVNQYYLNPSTLKKAYLDTKLYHFEDDRKEYERSRHIAMNKATLKYRAVNNKMYADALRDLEEFKSSDIYEQQREEIQKITPIIFDGYERLGYDKLVELEFNKKKIVTALLKLDVLEKRNTLPAFELVYNTFFVNKTYLMPEIKEKLQEIYDELGIRAKAKGSDIELYFHVKLYNPGTDGRSRRAYILQEAKHNPVERYQRK